MSLQLIFWIYSGYSISINVDLNYWKREVGVEISLVLTQMRKEKQCSWVNSAFWFCFLIVCFFSTVELMILVKAVLFGKWNHSLKCGQSIYFNILPVILYPPNDRSEVKVTHLCPTLCNPMGYTVHEILQARILEWVAFPFSRWSSQPRNQIQVSWHCRQILYQLSHKGSSRILQWPAYPFSRGSSRTRNQTWSALQEDSLPTELSGKP